MRLKLWVWLALAPGCFGALQVGELRTEWLARPLAVETPAPRLGWKLASKENGQRQTAYRILVAASAAALAQNRGDLWDTGRVPSSETVQINYAGRPLASRQQCFWKVQVWDAQNQASAWSAPAEWGMGLLKAEDWKAEWISHPDGTPLHTSREKLHLPPARAYRGTFQAAKPVRRAVLYGTALGIFDPYVNGTRAAETMFAPGWSDYGQRAYYRAWDVTALVKAGRNQLGAIVADGWYAGYVGYGLLVGYGPARTGRSFYGKTPALRLQLELEFADGARQTVGTGADWQQAEAPSREADLLMGETYDARMEKGLWTKSEGWAAAARAGAAGRIPAMYSDRGGEREVNLGFQAPPRLQAYAGPDVRPVEEIRPVRVNETKPGVFVFDLGQNISGVARLKVKGPAGTRVQLRFAEMVYPDGRLMTENLRKARATDTYILSGAPEGETWTPRFTYHGFQHVEVSGYPGRPGVEAITGVVVHSDTPLTSRWEASDAMLSRLHRNVVWTQRGNFVEIPTDCPQRDERLGWTGDAQIYARAATLHADTAAFYTKWLTDLEEAQRPNGAFPDYAPYPMQHGPKGYAYGTAWMDAGVIVPYHVWQAYGDTRLLERHWPAMTRFLRFRQELSPDGRGRSEFNDWGDWLAIGSSTPIEYVDAVYFAYSARLMAEMAGALRKQVEAGQYEALFGKIRARFQQDYALPGGRLKVDNQTAYALALANGLLTGAEAAGAAERLAQLVRENGGRMTTGFLGTYPLLPVLSAHGQHEMAVGLLRSREFPSWGYEVENGATTIWERWNSYTKDKGFFEPAMNSFSHYAFGAVSEWMFRGVAGIDTDGPGYRKLMIRPGPGSLEWVKAEYESVRGRVAVAWKQSPGRFELDVTVPPNVTATVVLPASAPVAAQAGVRFRELKEGRAWLEVESGTYRIETVNEAPSLKQAYRNHFKMGVAVNPGHFNETDAAGVELVKQHFNSITPENVLKWGPVHPQPEEYNFGPADKYVEFGQRHGMFVVGHTLVWHSQTPKWVFEDGQGQPLTREALLARMRDHIRTVVGRYKGRIHGWDVVNEALNEDGTMRQSPWYRIIGEDYVAKAFEYAREADPEAELYYNDYSLENEPKRKGAVALVRRLQAAGLKVSGIGTQHHNRLNSPTAEQIEATIVAFQALGVKVHVTELDVDVLPRAQRRASADISERAELTPELNPYTQGLPAEVEEHLARRYEEIFRVFAKHRDAVARVTFWGVTDRVSWLNNFPVRGRTNYPLLFDRANRPKAAFEAVMKAAQGGEQ
jgi:alpha-L-rhamnosidase